MSMSLRHSVIARLYTGFFKEFDLNFKEFTELRNATRCNVSTLIGNMTRLPCIIKICVSKQAYFINFKIKVHM